MSIRIGPEGRAAGGQAQPGSEAPGEMVRGEGRLVRRDPGKEDRASEPCWPPGGATLYLPAPTDSRWLAVVTRRESRDYEFLALNLLLTGVGLSLIRDPSTSNLEQAVQRVRALLARNGHSPTVQRDVARMFGGE